MTERASHLHYARVVLAQSRHFTRRHRGWSFTLLQWAANARRQAMACAKQINAPQGQMELF